jgi:hypothetical protein
MPFEWSAFVDLARELAEQHAGAAGSEVYVRTALSRAYFSAYGDARKYASGQIHPQCYSSAPPRWLEEW